MRLRSAAGSRREKTAAAALWLPEIVSIRKRSRTERTLGVQAWLVSAFTVTSWFPPEIAFDWSVSAGTRQGRRLRLTAWNSCQTEDSGIGLRLRGKMERLTPFSDRRSLLKNCAR